MGRVIVLGLDGMSPAMLQTLIDKGLMPNAAKFVDRANSSTLRSTIPFSTIPGWTTIFTGVLPGQHGLLWWKREDPWLPWGQPTERGFTTMHRALAPRLWNLLEGTGKRIAFVDVPATFPAPDINGTFISGFLGPWPHKRAVHPADIAEDVSGWLPSDGGVIESAPRSEAELIGRVDAITEAARQRRDVWRSLLTGDYDLVSLVLVGPDRLSHLLWRDMIPDTSDDSGVRAATKSYWETVDSFFVDLSAAAENGDDVLVCSDHGSDAPPSTRLHLDRWLVAAGFSTEIGPDGGRDRAETMIQRLERAVRPVSKPVLKAVRAENLGRAVKDRVRQKAWKGVSAREDEIFPVIMDDREAGFFLSPQIADPEATSSRLIEALREVSHAGKKVFERVGPADDFMGPISPGFAAPNVMAVSDADVGLAARQGVNDVFTPENKPQRGIHRREGILLFASSKQVRAGIDPGVEDVTPTILALLGVAIPSLAGTALVESDAEDIITVTSTAPDERDAAITHEEEEAIADHLRGLGYIE
ncbi:MAG: alkaline phosphatase family protein [Actinomycetota bacterium]|nr:alkaline phosphatase family protein [Actinomycetota bacterium]